jgi:hypothetical protein
MARLTSTTVQQKGSRGEQVKTGVQIGEIELALCLHSDCEHMCTRPPEVLRVCVPSFAALIAIYSFILLYA